MRSAAIAVGLLGALLVVAVLATTPGGAQAAAACDATPAEVAPGESVTLDASASENASIVEFDVDGDGTYEREDDTDFAIEFQYEEPGNYTSSVRVIEGPNDSDTAICGVVQVSPNEPPDAQLVAEPGTAGIGETVVLDASASTDPDGTIAEYRWDVDGDGTVDRSTGTPTIEHAYGTSGSYRARVTVVDDRGANASAATSVVVQDAPPVAACSVEPATVAVGETVTIDANGTTGADAVDVDLDGDGTVDRTLTATFETTATYDAPGTVEPTVTARNAAGDDLAQCGEIEIQAATNGTGDGADGGGNASGGEKGGSGGVLGALWSAVAGDGDGGPGSPEHLGGTVVLLGAAGWLFGRARQASDDPRPRGVFEWRSDIDERFATGRFRADGEAVDVEVGFEPDLLLLAARPDGEDGRTGAGGNAPIIRSNGVALRTDDGIRQHALGATTADGAAVVRGTGDDERRGRVTATHETGFELDADDGLDATVCYRAICLPADVTATVGSASVAADEEAVGLPEIGPIDALLLDAAAEGTDADGSGPSDAATAGAGWIGAGTAAGDGAEQTAVGEGDGDAVIVLDRALALGRDGPRARLVAEDASHSLAYDDGDASRSLAYDSPASVDHVLQFVALAGVPALGPATGTVEVPVDDGETAVPVGFEPAFVEYWVVPEATAAKGSPTGATGRNGASFGAALDGDDGIEQVSLGPGADPNGRGTISVVAVTEAGVSFAATAGDGATGTSVTVAFRAWPGPLGRRRDTGGIRQ